MLGVETVPDFSSRKPVPACCSRQRSTKSSNQQTRNRRTGSRCCSQHRNTTQHNTTTTTIIVKMTTTTMRGTATRSLQLSDVDQSNILFDLVQGQPGQNFANSRTGWDTQTPGESVDQRTTKTTVTWRLRWRCSNCLFAVKVGTTVCGHCRFLFIVLTSLTHSHIHTHTCTYSL